MSFFNRLLQILLLVTATAIGLMGCAASAQKDQYRPTEEGLETQQSNDPESNYKLGEMYYKEFEDIALVAKNEKEMVRVIKTKNKALEKSVQYFDMVSVFGVDEWTIRANYMKGKGFYDMAEALANRTLLGNAEEQMGGKIKVLSSLDKYYDKAIEYFKMNVSLTKQEDKDEYIEMSTQKMMETAYKKGAILEEVGLLFKNAPVPKQLTGVDRRIYLAELEDRYLKSLDAAIPVYEDGLRLAAMMGIPDSPWIDRIRERLAAIKQ